MVLEIVDEENVVHWVSEDMSMRHILPLWETGTVLHNSNHQPQKDQAHNVPKGASRTTEEATRDIEGFAKFIGLLVFFSNGMKGVRTHSVFRSVDAADDVDGSNSFM